MGWVPAFLEYLNYQIAEFAPDALRDLTKTPEEYFRRQMYVCFWFERVGPERLLDKVGEDNVLFQTDYPHPTSLSPGPGSAALTPLEHARMSVAGCTPEVARKVLSGNAERLYHLKGNRGGTVRPTINSELTLPTSRRAD